MNIYTVVGERGEYSDWTTWVAAGFFRKDNAESHAKRLNEIVSIYLEKHRAAGDWDEEDKLETEAKAELAPLDEVGAEHLSGTFYPPKYAVGSIEMKDKP